MKSSLRCFCARRLLFVASLSIGTASACISEKKVGAAISATDTTPSDTAATRAATRSIRATRAEIDTPPNYVVDTVLIPTNQAIRIRLVDMTETEEFFAYKVEVRLAGRVDTIPGVLTFDLPVIAPDGLLRGPAYARDAHYAGLYAYDPGTRALSNIPLPSDAEGWASEVKLSPDGSHIAYIGGFGDSTGSQGIVRTWPEAKVVLMTMKAPQAPSDQSFDQVWWVNRDSVEFSWHTDLGPATKPSDPRFPFIAIYTSLRAKRFTVDTLTEQPNFRTAGRR